MVDTLARTPLSTIVELAAACTIIRLALVKYIAATPRHKRIGPYKIATGVNSACDAIVYAGVLIFLGVRPFLFQAYEIPSESMVSTLLVGDLLGINKAVYRYTDPKRGDIVVFRPPAYACNPDQLDEKGEPKTDFIKRCIGLPGDLIEIKGTELYRNGQKIDEPYLHDHMATDWKLVKDGDTYIPLNIDGIQANAPGMMVAKNFQAKDDVDMMRLRQLPAEKIPPGHYLMMGDNRLRSFDGRGWGLITRQQVVGRAEFIWWPAPRIRALPRFDYHGK